MSLKNSKRRMRNGLMCPSEASTAVWSVVVPRSRSKRHERSVSLDDTRLIKCSSYSKLVHSATATFKDSHSLSSPNIQERSQDQHNGSTQLHKTTSDHVFQVTQIYYHHFTLSHSMSNAMQITNVSFISFFSVVNLSFSYIFVESFALSFALSLLFLSRK